VKPSYLPTPEEEETMENNFRKVVKSFREEWDNVYLEYRKKECCMRLARVVYDQLGPVWVRRCGLNGVTPLLANIVATR
jgi:hypothetical protein